MIGWLGTLLLFAGVYGIGYKWRPSFWLMFCGEVLWCIKAYQTSQLDLFVLAALFGMMDVLNWRKWGVKGNE